MRYYYSIFKWQVTRNTVPTLSRDSGSGRPIYKCVCIYVYIYTHIHTHTYLFSSSLKLR